MTGVYPFQGGNVVGSGSSVEQLVWPLKDRQTRLNFRQLTVEGV